VPNKDEEWSFSRPSSHRVSVSSLSPAIATEAAWVKIMVGTPASSTEWAIFMDSVARLITLRIIHGMPWKTKAGSSESDKVLFCGY